MGIISNIFDTYDANAEAMVLATLVYRPDYSVSSDRLLPEYFHDDFNSNVYWSICELYKNNIKKIDFASIDAKIKERYGKNTYVNQSNFSEFLDMASEFRRDALEDYMLFANRIITSAYRRETYRQAGDIQRLCLKDDSEIQDVQEKFRDIVSNLTEKFSVGEDNKLFCDIVQDMWSESRRRLKENNGVSGLPSKFTKLNDYVTYEKGELVVVAAQRKQGKSVFCMNESLHQLELDKNKRILYLDTELNSRSVMERLISNKAQINNRNLKSNNLTVQENERVSETIEWFTKNNGFIHHYRTSWTKEKIFSAVLYWHQKLGGLDLVVFDYMKADGDVLDSGSVYNNLGSLCNFLKNEIAGGFDVPVLAAAQLGRGGDIADSFKIEMFASTILNLRKKTKKEIDRDNMLGYGDLGNYRLSVKCNRSGDSHEGEEYIDLNFVGEHFDFQDIPKTPIDHSSGESSPY